MNVFPPDVNEAVSKMNSRFIKGSEFEKGLSLKCKEVKKLGSDETKYGASEDSKLVASGILEEGQTFRYLFETSEGLERIHDSHSFPLFIGFQQGEVEQGDWIHITRTGKGDKTRYTVEKLSQQPAATPIPTKEYPQPGIGDVPNPEEIPF